MALPDHIQAFFGDYQWWSRPECFAHPQCREVEDLDAAKDELQRLFPADVCRRLAEASDGHPFLGLFLGDGWSDLVGIMVLLGDDLRHCPGWHDHPKLVWDLRAGPAFEAARFEVGVWAGLRRSGISPRYEAGGASDAHPDFLFEEAGLGVALELKSVGASNAEHNLYAIERAISREMPVYRDADRHSLHVALDEEVRRQASTTARRDFEIAPIVRAARDFYADGVRYGAFDVPGIGEFVVQPLPPGAPDSMAGQFVIDGGDGATFERSLARALRPIRHSALEQLNAVNADLRVAVVWAGRTAVPVPGALGPLDDVVRREPETFGRLDGVVIVNCHRLGRTPGWKTEAALYICPWSRHPMQEMTWPHALIEWSLLR